MHCGLFIVLLSHARAIGDYEAVPIDSLSEVRRQELWVLLGVLVLYSGVTWAISYPTFALIGNQASTLAGA